MSYIFEKYEYEELMYTDYHKYEFFKTRANKIANLYPNKETSILIAGCGFGYLVEELLELGYEKVYGFDASNYALDKVLSDFRYRVMKGNILYPQNLQAICNFVGVDKFDLAITEDCLPCAWDEKEAQVMIDNLQNVSYEQFHIITCGLEKDVEDGFRTPLLLWRSMKWWKEKTNARLLCSETRMVI